MVLRDIMLFKEDSFKKVDNANYSNNHKEKW
jgi:hypothetical protein